MTIKADGNTKFYEILKIIKVLLQIIFEIKKYF